jgi:hypothetical protein
MMGMREEIGVIERSRGESVIGMQEGRTDQDVMMIESGNEVVVPGEIGREMSARGEMTEIVIATGTEIGRGREDVISL